MPSFSQQVRAFIDSNLSPAARSKTLAAEARAGRQSLIASGRASATYQTFVDGRSDPNEDHVRGDGGGVIVYRFDVQAQAAVFALGFLRARAPVRSGKFRDSFFVAVGGRFISAVQFEPASVPPGAEIIIGNSQPYDRLVDVQISGTKPVKYSVPAGMYDDCVSALRRQFGSAVQAKRLGNIRFPGQYTLRNGRNSGTPVSSPVVVISAVG